MPQTIHGITFEPPPEFVTEEVMMSMRAPPQPDLKVPLATQRQLAVRPNLIVHRKTVSPDATLELLTGEICAELMTSIGEMQNLTTERFAFDDGTPGIIIAFDFIAPQLATIRQFQAVRLDRGGSLTTLTLTVDLSKLNEAAKLTYLKCLSSCRVDVAKV